MVSIIFQSLESLHQSHVLINIEEFEYDLIRQLKPGLQE